MDASRAEIFIRTIAGFKKHGEDGFDAKTDDDAIASVDWVIDCAREMLDCPVMEKWEVGEDGGDVFCGADVICRTSQRFLQGGDRPSPTMEEKRRALILAASNDMLMALCGLSEIWDAHGCIEDEEEWSHAHAAIAKATGE